MLPPICVNSWLSQSSRNGRLRKTSSAPAVSSGSSRPSSAASTSASGQDVRRLVGHRRRWPHGCAQHRVSAADEPGDAAFETRALHQHMPTTGLAAKADVGAEPVHEPGVAPAGMTSLQAQDVAQVELEHGFAGHRPEGSRGRRTRNSRPGISSRTYRRGVPSCGFRSRSVGGRLSLSSVLTVITASG